MSCCFMIPLRLAGRKRVGQTLLSCNYRKVTNHVSYDKNTRMTSISTTLHPPESSCNSCLINIESFLMYWPQIIQQQGFRAAVLLHTICGCKDMVHFSEAAKSSWSSVQQMFLIPPWHSNIKQPEEVTVEIPRRMAEGAINHQGKKYLKTSHRVVKFTPHT